MRRKPAFDQPRDHAVHLEISMRMSLFVHEFSAGVRTRCLCCMQPHLEIRACSINIRMQTSASCDVESAAWARTEFVFALVNSVGRDATAADVGGATSLQLMLKRLNRRALSAWRSNGKAERRSRRICRTLTTDGRLHDNACRPKYVERSIFCPYPVRPVGFCARRCAAEWRLPDSPRELRCHCSCRSKIAVGGLQRPLFSHRI